MEIIDWITQQPWSNGQVRYFFICFSSHSKQARSTHASGLPNWIQEAPQQAAGAEACEVRMSRKESMSTLCNSCHLIQPS